VGLGRSGSGTDVVRDHWRVVVFVCRIDDTSDPTRDNPRARHNLDDDLSIDCDGGGIDVVIERHFKNE
jgi:hypothetical protein